MSIMIEFSFAVIVVLLQQSVQGFLFAVLEINLWIHFILILSFLVITWNRKSSQLGTLKAGKAVLGCYIVFLVIDLLIYIVEILYGGLPPFLGGEFILILYNPVLFFVFFTPPLLLMYLDIQQPESSGHYSSLSNSALALFVWLVVIVIAIGATTGTILYS